MDFDATIERLNALKLQERPAASATPSAAPPAAHHVDGMHAELRRLQDENARLAREQERQTHRWQLEMHDAQTRLAAAEHQNQLLKAALGEVDAYRREAQAQQLVIDELQTQVKQLRLANYRLQYVVQQSDGGGPNPFLPPRPPDIF